MKKYLVTFKETYIYTKEVEIEDHEDINGVIHDPLDFPMVAHMTDEQYNNLNPDVCNEYIITDKS